MMINKYAACLSLALFAVSGSPCFAEPEDGQDSDASPLPERSAYTGVSNDVFARHSWYTPPPQPKRAPAPKPVERKPVAPPLPYTLLGSYEESGAETMYFLVKGNNTYDVHVGDTLEDTYRVDGVSNGQLMFTYLPLNTSQGLRLGD